VGDRAIDPAAGTQSKKGVGSGTPNEHLRFSVLILVMVLIAALSSAGSFWMLYRAAFEQQRMQLVEMAQGHARLLVALVESERHHGVAKHSDDGNQHILSHIYDIYERYRNPNENIEITLSRRQADNVVHLIGSRRFLVGNRDQLISDPELAQPARRALSGQSGSMIGLDYRRVTVLAAYEPVPEFGLGVVAKIDLAEVYAPFVRAGLLIGGGLSVFLVLAVVTIYRLGTPLVAEAKAARSLRAWALPPASGPSPDPRR